MSYKSRCLRGGVVALLLAQGCQTPATAESPAASHSPAAHGAEVDGVSESSAKLHTAELMVEGSDCASCSVPIRRHLKQLSGVTDIRQGQTKKHVMLDFDPAKVSPEQIVQAVHEAGYEAEVLVYAKTS